MTQVVRNRRGFTQNQADGWMKDAACQGLPLERFFPEKGDSQTVRRARGICRGCPVQGKCLSYAIEFKIGFGIWGGLSVRERTALARGMRTG